MAAKEVIMETVAVMAEQSAARMEQSHAPRPITEK